MSAHQPTIYAQCGIRIRSALRLDLPVSPGEQWDVDVRWADDDDDDDDGGVEPPPTDVIAEYRDGPTTWYTVSSDELGYVVDFPDCGRFRISNDLSAMWVRPYRDGRADLLPILLAGTVSATLLSLRRETVLHASAVATDERVLALVGRSGQGKSTLAALLCLAGAELVGDDLITVQPGPPATCQGGATALRLRASAAHLADLRPERPSYMTADDRRAFSPRPAAPGRLPLGAIVVPEPSRSERTVRLRRLGASDAMVTLMSAPRIYGWRRHEVLRRDFAVLGQLANHLPVYVATIPWGPPFDPTVGDELMRLAHTSDRPGSDGDPASS